MKRPTRPLVEERGQHCEAHVDFGFIVHTASATRQDQVLLHLFRDDLLVSPEDLLHDLREVDKGLRGRVPAGCGYCFETSLMPPEWCLSAGDHDAKPVFTPRLPRLAGL